MSDSQPESSRKYLEIITLDFPEADTVKYLSRDSGVGVEKIPAFTLQIHVPGGNNWGVNNAVELLTTLFKYQVTAPEVLEVILRATGHTAPTPPSLGPGLAVIPLEGA